jgi:thioredoxin 1
MTHVTEVNDANFESEVLQSQQPVLVDFWAGWCAPCRAVAPIVEELAKSYEGKLKIMKIDVDQNSQIPIRYGVRSIPTLLIFKDGKIVDLIVGAVPKDTIDQSIIRVLGYA